MGPGGVTKLHAPQVTYSSWSQVAGDLLGARCYALNVDGFMGKGYLMAKATLWPRLPYGCALLGLECWRLYGQRLPYGKGYLVANATLWVRVVRP